MTNHALCRLDEIPINGAKGIEHDSRSLVLVRTPEGVFAYENVCPHRGTPLDWVPDRFLTLDKKLIQCATHGAQFRIEDGYCVFGPCAGASLSGVGTAVVGEMVVLSG